MLSVLYEEKIIKEMGEDAYLTWLRDLGIGHFELGIAYSHLDDYGLSPKRWTGFDWSYHLPYHASGAYEPGQERSLQGQRAYDDFFALLHESMKKNHTIVVHPGLEGDKQTLDHLDYLLNRLVRENLSVQLALETIPLGSHDHFFTRQAAAKIVSSFAGAPLGICADLAHELKALGEISPWSPQVIHAHLHGFGGQGMHHHLTPENKSLFKDHLQDYLDKTVLVLEHLKEDEYRQKMEEDIAWIKKRGCNITK